MLLKLHTVLYRTGKGVRSSLPGKVTKLVRCLEYEGLQVCISVWSVGMSCSRVSQSLNMVHPGPPSRTPSIQTQ